MDTLIDPVTVRMTKERNNSILAGALPSLRTVTDLHYKKVCAVLGRLDPIMRATSDAVAKASMGAQQEPGAVAFGMRLDHADDIACKTREGLFRHDGKFEDQGRG